MKSRKKKKKRTEASCWLVEGHWEGRVHLGRRDSDMSHAP